METEYFLGLDIGTGSVGWALTNAQYEIQRARGKALWGVRLFDSASTAEERRIFRTGRRRLARRNWRLELLQQLFVEEIEKMDQGFYLRMKESRYVPEDKRGVEGECPALPYALFVDCEYTDKDYHKQFPTIYHLRQWLMETKDTPDIRLVYLALHHMMKHRGHFLFAGNIENAREFKGVFGELISSIKEEELDFHTVIPNENLSQIEEILKNTHLTKTAKKSSLNKLLGVKTGCEKAIVNLLVGGTVKLSDIFDNKELDAGEKPKICFSESGYDDYSHVVETELGEQYFIIEQAKAVYDWMILADILGEFTSLSQAKIALYEKHKKDLIYLKKLVKNHLSKDIYNTIFLKTDSVVANYSAYIGSVKLNGEKESLEGKQCGKEEFYALLRKMVCSVLPEEQISYLVSEMEKGTFLPRQVTKDNGVIPYQVHLYELDKIIENLQERIPLLKQQGKKIRKIFTFRIPYYVGPLNGICKGEKSTNWVQRTGEKIYPWNFEEVVDEDTSAERFIKRMTNKCTYLHEEDVLPKNSMLYAKFEVLNELNNLRLNGNVISVELKQKIYEDVFQRYRKVTQKRLRDYLVREGIVGKGADITGIDGDFKGALTAYHDFKEKLTGCELKQEEKEHIILDVTLFGEDKRLLEKRLGMLYPSLTVAQKKGICTLSYKGWGRLSAKLLDGIVAPAPETGEVWSVIRALWDTNDNLMQILSSKYAFAEAIEDENGKNQSKEIGYEQINALSISPAVKRQIWQTLQVVKELCKVKGYPPKRIFVEMAREKGESKRTDSRKKTLMELYKACKGEERDWLTELGATEIQKFRGDKLYLYYTQKGRCMYSGEIIPLEELWDNRKYDIDHIYPQSKVMDDSLANRVLVKKTYNAEKTDHYPISQKIREKMQPFWKVLLEGGFIPKEKYERLVRATEFEPVELEGFIQRQLVETRQGTKAVASILKQVLPDTEIVYVKAKIASQFRKDFDLIKVRELNDFHHAQDAYLNIVVGNVYFTKFTKNASWFIKEHPGRSYNLKKMFTSEKNIEQKGEVAWYSGEKGSIYTVKKTMQKHNILVTRRAYQVKGQLFDQQPMKKGKGQVPIKGSDERLLDIEKYGGYNKATGSYYMLVESEDKKGNKIRTIECVPLYRCLEMEKNELAARNYLVKERELKNPQILIPKIKIDSLFKVDGFYMWLSGRTGNRLIFKGANQLLLSQKEAMTLKKVLKYVDRKKENKDLKLTEHDNVEKEALVGLYDTFLNKIQNTVFGIRLGAQEKFLLEKRDTFMQLSEESKCVLLSELLHLFQCQSCSANLKLLSGPASAGILVLNSNITNCKQISIINQSITGIYEQEIDLLKV